MPFSRITTNFCFANESVFIDEFQKIMIDVLHIPEDDRLIFLDQKTNGLYQPTGTSGKYMLFEIDMFAGRTIETKKKLYKALFTLANSFGVENTNANVILKDIEKQNWGIQGGQPASEVDLGFNTDI